MFKYSTLLLTVLTYYAFTRPEVITERQGNIVNYYKSNDVLCFISHNLEAAQDGKKFPQYLGLSDEGKVTRLLEKQDYIEVLKYVWSEHNKEKRLAWLKKGAEKGHIICMFELSKEYGLQGNTAECHFWLFLGTYRTKQDVLCCTDISLADCPDFLRQCYYPFYQAAVSKDSAFSEKNCLGPWNYHQLKITGCTKVFEHLKNCHTFPSPAWLHLHGLDAWSKSKDSMILHPEKTFSAKRKEIVDGLEREVNELRSQVFIKAEVNPNDVLWFMLHNSEAAQNNKPYGQYPGLCDEDKVTRLLEQQDYIEVLKHVWSENNKEKRLLWLKKGAEKGHIICMFELGKEYAIQGNALEGFFWLFLGTYRTEQDILCCTDPSLDHCARLLNSCYLPYYGKLVSENASFCDKNSLREENFMRMNIEACTRVVEYLKNCQKFPSPGWLSPHGFASTTQNSRDSMLLHPEKTFSAKRKKVADDVVVKIKGFEDALKTLHEKKAQANSLASSKKK